jgi:hypothetical protein
MKRWPGARPALADQARRMGIMMATTGVLLRKAEMIVIGIIIRTIAPARQQVWCNNTTGDQWFELRVGVRLACCGCC